MKQTMLGKRLRILIVMDIWLRIWVCVLQAFNSIIGPQIVWFCVFMRRNEISLWYFSRRFCQCVCVLRVRRAVVKMCARTIKQAHAGEPYGKRPRESEIRGRQEGQSGKVVVLHAQPAPSRSPLLPAEHLEIEIDTFTAHSNLSRYHNYKRYYICSYESSLWRVL